MYLVLERRVYIAAIIHGARRLPKALRIRLRWINFDLN